VLGRGLLTSEGDFWMRQRRLMQPAFYHDRVQSYAAIMTGYTEQMLETWRDGETRDIHEDMMALTLRIVVKALFGADVRDEAPAIGEALTDVLRSLTTESMFFPALQKIPTRRNRRLRRAIARLNQTIYRIIDQRRAGRKAETPDVLEILLAARDEDGSAMSDEQIRDEVMTLFLAGHETTALALSWTFYLLSQHPEIGEKLCEAVDGEDGSYVKMVLNESMRVYPPVWGIGREAIRDCEVGGYAVPRRSQIWINQWVLHRDPRYFENPDDFSPDRWSGDFAKRLPKFAYFPFGGGPRMCIGQSFALMEAALILSAVARRFQLRLAPDAKIEPVPTITLRPRYGVPMIVSRR
jgi:cytochrome P450